MGRGCIILEFKQFYFHIKKKHTHTHKAALLPFHQDICFAACFHSRCQLQSLKNEMDQINFHKTNYILN